MNAKTRKNYPAIKELPTSMLAIEHILPAQLSSSPLEQVIQKKGEFQLLMAILEDAIHCFTTYLLAKKTRDQRLFQEAEEWINLEDPQWSFSFDNVCLALNIHPDRLRTELKKWKEKQLAQKEKGVGAKSSIRLPHKTTPAVPKNAQPAQEELTTARELIERAKSELKSTRANPPQPDLHTASPAGKRKRKAPPYAHRESR